MSYFAHVVDGEILRINISLPTSIGSSSVGKGGTHPELYPITGSEPAFNPLTQRLAGPTYAFTGTEVTRNYTIEDIPQEELDAKAREAAKAGRTVAVEAITVTTTAGNTFDGDETSQTRMARAIIALNATGTPTVNWVLSDNTVIQASAAELSEALALAGAAQAAVWVI